MLYYLSSIRFYRSRGHIHPSARRACQSFGPCCGSAAQRSARPFSGWCADTYCAAHATVRSGVLSMANAGPNTNREPPRAHHPIAVPRAAPAQRRAAFVRCLAALRRRVCSADQRVCADRACTVVNSSSPWCRATGSMASTSSSARYPIRHDACPVRHGIPCGMVSHVTGSIVADGSSAQLS